MACNSRNMVCGTVTDDCLVKLKSKCILYDGPATTNIGYITNMSLTDLLLLIDEAVGSPSGTGSYISTTPTILVSGLGSQSNPYTLTARRSTDTGNELVLGTDGALFVAPPTDSGSGFNI
jgi:hypothetical protein